MNTYEDDEFARIEMEQSIRENKRLGLYDDVYGIPFVEQDELKKLLSGNEIQQTPSNT
jgi:predicted transcriptional regulator